MDKKKKFLHDFFLKNKLKSRQIKKLFKNKNKKERILKYNLLGTIKTHNGPIERILCTHSIDKTFLISSGYDGLIKIFDVDNQLLVQTLYGHKSHIFDVCLHSNGDCLVSADTLGIVLLHKLKNGRFVLLKKINLEAEVLFCEFVKGRECKNIKEIRKEPTSYEFVVLTVMGVLLYFDEQGEEIHRNELLSGNAIKSCCITDGGRYIFCGGDWCYLFVIDVYSPNKLFKIEDFYNINPMANIKYIVGAKNGFKVATSYENTVAIYFHSGTKMKHSLIDISEYTTGGIKPIMLNMEFLSNGLLVILGTDRILRVYYNDYLISITPDILLGSLYVHSFLNLFCIADETRIVFYLLNKKMKAVEVHKIMISIPINNGQFSNNGDYFITSDFSGSLNFYKLNFNGMYKETMQYFKFDLITNNKLMDTVINCILNIDFKRNVFKLIKQCNITKEEFVQLKKKYPNKFDLLYECVLYGNTYDPKNKNLFWKKSLLEALPKPTSNIWVRENVAFRSLNKYKVYKEEITQLPGIYTEQIDMEESSSTETQTQLINSQDLKNNTKCLQETKPLNNTRIIIESSSEVNNTIGLKDEDILIENDEETALKIFNAMNSTRRMLRSEQNRLRQGLGGVLHKEDPSSEIVLRKSKIRRPGTYERSKMPSVSPDEENKKLQKSVPMDFNSKEEEKTDLYTKKKDNIRTLIEKTPFKKSRRLIESIEEEVSGLKDDEKRTNTHIDDKDPYKKWLFSIPYGKHDEVYINADYYKKFCKEEVRITTNTEIQSGFYTISDINPGKMYLKKDKGEYIVYLKLTLEKNRKMYKNINFYECRDSEAGILCLKIQKNYKKYDTVTVDGIRGQIEETNNLKIKVNGNWYLQSEIFVGNEGLDLSEFFIDDACDYKTPQFFMNYDRINYRIQHNFYKTAGELKRDLIQLSVKFKDLDFGYYKHVQGIIEKLAKH